MLFRFLYASAVVLLASAAGVVLLASAADAQSTERLGDDFNALATYDFGMSRAPLQRISEAVRAVAAGHPGIPYTTADFEKRLSAMLETDISLEAKRFICHLLGEIGGAAATDVLAKSLDDDALFHTALLALEQNPGDEAAAALASALAHAPVEKRLALLSALGRQGNPVSIGVLAGVLGDASPEATVAAAQALADIAHPDACRAVIDSVKGASQESWLLLADACLDCADTLRATDVNTATETLEYLRQSSFPTHIRIAAIDGLMRCNPDRTQALLIEALQDESPVLAHEALMLARAYPAAEVVAAITALLEQAAPDRKAVLLSILADFGDASALPAVMAMADHEQPEVRRAALRTIGILGSAAQTDFLLARSTSGPMDEQRVAREVLSRLADPETNMKLLAVATGRGAEDVRIRAIVTLAERRADNAAQAFLALSSRATPAIREESVRALRVLAPPDMLPNLLALVRPRMIEPVREALPQTLAQTALRIAEPADRAEAVAASLRAAKDNEVRVVLLEALGLIGGEQAFEAVRTCPESTVPEVRRGMVAALSRFQTPEALSEIQAILLVEQDKDARPQAYSAYVSSLRNASQMALRDVIPHVRTAYELARSVAERREFLAMAPQLPSLMMLDMVESMRGDEEIAAEALRALLQVSVALVGAYPEVAGKKLEIIAADATTPEQVAGEARQALSLIDRFEGYIVSWAVAGPYFEANISADALFSRELPPEADPDKANWRVLKTLPNADPPYILPLDKVIGGDDRVVFLRTTITAPEAREAVIELGTNDGCRVWWNGTLIHGLNVGRAAVPGEDKLPVQLATGDNELMLAVFQHGAAWSAVARMVDKDGQLMPGLICRPGIGDL